MPSITITTTAPQAQRLATAFGRELGLRDEQGAARNATADEIKAAAVAYLRRVVQQQESYIAQEQHADVPFDPS